MQCSQIYLFGLTKLLILFRVDICKHNPQCKHCQDQWLQQPSTCSVDRVISRRTTKSLLFRSQGWTTMKESLCNLRQNEIFRVFFMSFKTQNTAKTRSKQLSPGEASESMHTIKAKFLKCFLLFHTVIEQKWSYTPMWGNGVVYNKPGATERTQFVRASLEDV